MDDGCKERVGNVTGVKLTGCDESPPAFGITVVSVLSGKPSRDIACQ